MGVSPWRQQMPHLWSVTMTKPDRCSEALQDAGKASWLEVNAHWILADPAVPLVTSSFSRKARFSYHVRFSLLEIQPEAMCRGVWFSVGLFQCSPLLLSQRTLSNDPGRLSPVRWERNRVEGRPSWKACPEFYRRWTIY